MLFNHEGKSILYRLIDLPLPTAESNKQIGSVAVAAPQDSDSIVIKAAGNSSLRLEDPLLHNNDCQINIVSHSELF